MTAVHRSVCLRSAPFACPHPVQPAQPPSLPISQPLRTYVFMMWKISWKLQWGKIDDICCRRGNWKMSFLIRDFCSSPESGLLNEQSPAHAPLFAYWSEQMAKTFTANTAWTTIKQQNFDKLLPCWHFMSSVDPNLQPEGDSRASLH